MKWLSDVAAFLAQLSPDARAQAIAYVNDGPNSDALAQTLHLCDTYFGTTYDPEMSQRAQTLYEFARVRIETPYYETTRLKREFAVIRRYFATRHVYKNTWSALWALKYTLISKDDLLVLKLPFWLYPIYPLIRIPSLIIRRLRA